MFTLRFHYGVARSPPLQCQKPDLIEIQGGITKIIESDSGTNAGDMESSMSTYRMDYNVSLSRLLSGLDMVNQELLPRYHL
jgi:hypothetical protein